MLRMFLTLKKEDPNPEKTSNRGGTGIVLCCCRGQNEDRLHQQMTQIQISPQWERELRRGWQCINVREQVPINRAEACLGLHLKMPLAGAWMTWPPSALAEIWIWCSAVQLNSYLESARWIQRPFLLVLRLTLFSWFPSSLLKKFAPLLSLWPQPTPLSTLTSHLWLFFPHSLGDQSDAVPAGSVMGFVWLQCSFGGN